LPPVPERPNRRECAVYETAIAFTLMAACLTNAVCVYVFM
jgi:hypothetical protein